MTKPERSAWMTDLRTRIESGEYHVSPEHVALALWQVTNQAIHAFLPLGG